VGILKIFPKRAARPSDMASVSVGTVRGSVHMGPDFDGHRHFHGPHHGGHGPGWFLPGFGAMALVASLLVLLWASGYGAALVAWVRAAMAPDPWRARWTDAVARHRDVAVAFAAYECDPRSVLDRPALADVRQPATARFVDAFAEASALLTERCPGSEVAQRLVDAVEREERAWSAAVDAAGRIGDARFSEGERALLARVRTLLEVMASSPFEAERRTAFQQAQRRLTDLARHTGWHLPRPAAVALEHRARGVLLPAAA
jgi:hypothetical protein